MPINAMYFQPETFQQANPFLSGMQAGQGLFQGMQDARTRQLQANALQAQLPFVAPEAQQQLQAAKLANALQQNTLNFAPQMSAADLAQKQAQPQLTLAQAAAQRALPGLYGAEGASDYANAARAQVEANLRRQQTPFLVQQEQEKLYQDPILSRMYQVGLANQTGAIPSSSMNMLGLGNQSGVQPGTQSNYRSLPTYANGFSLANPNLPNNALTAPKTYTGDSAQNYYAFGTPYSPLQMAQLKGQAEETGKTGVTSWNDAQAEAQKDSDIANTTIPLLNQFNDSYKKSTYTGKLAGVPVTGFASLLSGNTSNEQAADNASQNIAAAVAKLIAGGRVTNYEMQYINNLKPNRYMSPQTAQMASDFLKSKMQQLGEQQNFLNAARNAGVDVQTAQTLWQNYRNQRNPYDFNNRRVNTNFQGTWKDYLSPQAINAAQTGQNYVPLPKFSSDSKLGKSQFQSWYAALTPANQMQVRQEMGKQQ